jgi:hypothetical protein
MTGFAPPGGIFHGRQKYLWGNVPAFDILKAQHNEVDISKDLHLLFAGLSSVQYLANS